MYWCHCILFFLCILYDHIHFRPLLFLEFVVLRLINVIRITVPLVLYHYDALCHLMRVFIWCSQWTLGAIDVICNLWMQAMNAIFCISCHCAICRGVVCSSLYALKSCVWSSCCFCGGSQHLKMAFAVFWSVFVVWTMRPCNISIVLSLSLSLCRYSMAESVFVFVS